MDRADPVLARRRGVAAGAGAGAGAGEGADAGEAVGAGVGADDVAGDGRLGPAMTGLASFPA